MIAEVLLYNNWKHFKTAVRSTKRIVSKPDSSSEIAIFLYFVGWSCTIV